MTVDFAGHQLINDRLFTKTFKSKNQIKIKYYKYDESTGLFVNPKVLEFVNDKPFNLDEYTIADLRKDAPTPHAKKFLKIRQKDGEQGSFLTDVSWTNNNLNLIFLVKPTYTDSQGNFTKGGAETTTKKNYTVKVRLQEVDKILINKSIFLNLSKGEQILALRLLISSADILLHSDDPSWIMHSSYENASELGYSIYPFPSGIPKATGRWAQTKTGSSETPFFSLSKHAIEVLTILPFIPDQIAKMIREKYGSSD